AAAGGNGGVNIQNRNGGKLLSIETVQAVTGVTGNGNITLNTDGDLVLRKEIRDTNLVSPHTVTLISGGEIIDANGASRNVEANRLVATAVKNIELDTEVNELFADITGQGDLTIREASSIVVRDVELADGDVTVTAGNNITVGSLAVDANTGDVSLTAGGRIDDDENNATLISANTLTLSAGGSIGDQGIDTERSLDTDVTTLTATANGAVHIEEQNDLDLLSLITSDGNVTVRTGGLLNVGTIVTGTDDDTITLEAQGTIANGKTSGINLTAADVALYAGAGIGIERALTIEAGRLEAVSNLEGINILDQSGDLTIGGVTPNLSKPALPGLYVNNGDINVRTVGSLTIDESVVNTG